jgi:biopolymer transport protein ExbD/biopolymer transport protein TolR
MAFSTRSGGGRVQTQTALAEINITPLVDVVLVLLLIFMLTAPVLQSGIDVALPHTRSTQTLTEERMVVTIDKDQNVYLQTNGTDKLININNLSALLKDSQHAETSRTVYVRADERVPFGAFANVMENIKSAGDTNISIVTQPYEK